MKKWLQRIRGALGGLTWAAGWGVLGAILALIGVFGALGSLPDHLAFAGFFAVFGFLAGATFSGVLGIAGRRRRFDEMSLPRFAAWGALGGLLLTVFMLPSMFTLANVVAFSVVTLLAAASAAGSLALARRAEDRDLLEAGEEALGLLEGEGAQ